MVEPLNQNYERNMYYKLWTKYETKNYELKSVLTHGKSRMKLYSLKSPSDFCKSYLWPLAFLWCKSYMKLWLNWNETIPVKFRLYFFSWPIIAFDSWSAVNKRVKYKTKRTTWKLQRKPLKSGNWTNNFGPSNPTTLANKNKPTSKQIRSGAG